MSQTIITPISEDGEVSPVSMLVKKSEFRIFCEKIWNMAVYILAAIGFGTVLSWLI